MSIEQQRNVKRNEPRPCRVCGTPSRTGKEVETIGWVGPDCAKKVAALNATLEAEGLSGLFGKAVPFTPSRGTDKNGLVDYFLPEDIESLKLRAEGLGLKFTYSWVEFGRLAYASVSLPSQKAPRKRLFNRIYQTRAESGPKCVAL